MTLTQKKVCRSDAICKDSPCKICKRWLALLFLLMYHRSAMKRNPDFSLILPCYNEALLFRQSVENIVHALRLSRFTFEIIFVDDKSADDTPRLISLACKTYPFCRAIFHTMNRGRGKSVSDGVGRAKGRIVGYIDIDCEVSPLYILSCVDLIDTNKADVVVGRRVYRSSVSSFVREVLSVGYKRLVHLFFATNGIDTESGYKFFNRTTIVPIIKKTKSSHWFWDTEIIVRSLKAHLRVAEIPVLFIRRFDKKSSLRLLPDMLDYLIQLFRLYRTLL